MNFEKLQISRLEKKLPGFTLQADFDLEPGSRAAIVGRSGSGKTTLLRMIAGLEWVDSGRVIIGENDVTSWAPEKRDVGFVFQDQALFASMSVMENASFGLMMRSVSREERESRVKPWLDRVDLAQQIDTPVGRLSGGERQRLAFVRAWVWSPRIILLDEPFSALDTALRQSLRRQLVELHQVWPVPLLMVTHDEEDSIQVATTRVVLNEKSGLNLRVFSRESR